MNKGQGGVGAPTSSRTPTLPSKMPALRSSRNSDQVMRHCRWPWSRLAWITGAACKFALLAPFPRGLA